MKRIISLAVLFAVIALPSIAFAAEKTGIYVAPKLITGWTNMNAKSIDKTDGSSSMFNKTKGTIGGGLAIGYDFYRQSQVPVRAEVEYSAFSATKGKYSEYDGLPETPDNGDTIDTTNANAKIQAQTLFLNAYYDFHNSSKITPYVSAGLGLAFLRAKTDFVSTEQEVTDKTKDPIEMGSVNSTSGTFGAKTTTNFAWNVGAGASYDVTDTLSIDLGYRFASLGSAKTKSYHGNYVKFKNVNMHQIALGARLTF